MSDLAKGAANIPAAVDASDTPPVRLRRGPLLQTSANDRYFDYCLEPYVPRRPWRGKLRAENLFWETLDEAGHRAALREPLTALQASLGTDMTVWGVKWDGDRLFSELYFYDPQKTSPAMRVESITKVLAPWIRIAPRLPESVPYMMASFDLSSETTRTGVIEELNLYLTGEKEHSGRSYKLREGGVELENTYRFFPAKLESGAIVDLLKSSFFVDYSEPRTLSKVLIPELFACKKICVSKKRTCDAIYYSGISIEQLIWFLKRFAYPPRILGFAKEHAARLDHIYFDVGIDYWMDANGAVVYRKTSFYGTL